MIELRVIERNEKEIGMKNEEEKNLKKVIEIEEFKMREGEVEMDIELKRRIGEREEGRENKNIKRRKLKEGFEEILKKKINIGEIGRIVEKKKIEMMENRRMGGVGINKIGIEGDEDENRIVEELIIENGGEIINSMKMKRRSVSEKKIEIEILIRVEEESVVNIERRMELGEVERGEIIIVGIDIRKLGNGKKNIRENRSDIVDKMRNRMDEKERWRDLKKRESKIKILKIKKRGKRRIEKLGNEIDKGIGEEVIKEIDGRKMNMEILRRNEEKSIKILRKSEFIEKRWKEKGINKMIIKWRGNVLENMELELL